MRRLLAVLLCICLFTTIVYADNAASTASSTATVTASGSCQVTLSITIRLDQAVDSLSLPLGPDVSGVSLNGATASVSQSDGITSVRLNNLKNQVGLFPLTIHYTLNSVVTADDSGRPMVSIPLLYGFAYPVEEMRFSVTMPGDFDTIPAFYSGYHEQDIERSITSTVSGTMISGTVNEPLKDHETLFLQLVVPEGMFPQSKAVGGSLVFDAIAMGVCAVLALVYWLLTMRCLPSYPIRRSTPSEGLNAGNLGSYLVHKPADLTMMVVTWAQRGYLFIHLDDHGRVILHKKMDMGNERSSFEQKCFRALFKRKVMVDATGTRYASLCLKTEQLSRRLSAAYLPSSGNPRLFRLIACGVGLFAGVAIGDCITTAPAWRIVWMLLMGALSAVSSWYIQEGMSALHLQEKADLIISLILSTALIAVSSIFNCLGYGICAVCWNLFAGLAAAYGGRRSETGKRLFTEILGLRRYMRKVTKPELMRILRSNSDYYYELAPYAIALGVDRRFAKRFGNLRHPSCGWLVAGFESPRTAAEFYPLLREAVSSMNRLRRQNIIERFLHLR